jgi:hypothetical protein
MPNTNPLSKRPTENVLGVDLKPGDIIWNHGYMWRILDVMFDPYGNTGNSPRYCPTVECVNQEEQINVTPGPGYTRSPITFGLRTDLFWSRVIP